jgi:hypothetical protein
LAEFGLFSNAYHYFHEQYRFPFETNNQVQPSVGDHLFARDDALRFRKARDNVVTIHSKQSKNRHGRLKLRDYPVEPIGIAFFSILGEPAMKSEIDFQWIIKRAQEAARDLQQHVKFIPQTFALPIGGIDHALRWQP